MNAKQLKLIAAVFRRIERDRHYDDLLMLAGRDSSLSVPETLQVWDTVLVDAEAGLKQ